MAGWDNLAIGLNAAIPMAFQGMQDAEDRKYRRMEMEAKLKAQDDNQRRQEMLDRYEMEKNSPERRKQQMQFELAKSGQEGMWDENDPNVFVGSKYREDALRKSRAGQGGFLDPYNLKQMQAQKLKADLEKTAFEKTPQGKIEKMSGDQRKRFDETVGTLNALTDLSSSYGELEPKNQAERAYQMSQNPVRRFFVGDTPYTESATRFQEFLGRLQSGGAITKEEKDSFKTMIPGAGDSPEIAKKKLANLEFELGNRIGTFGISKDEATGMGLLKKGMLSAGAPSQAGGLIQKSQAAQMTPQDNQALEWAKKNPKDPRAAKILSRLGM